MAKSDAISRREYKVMLDHRMFADRKPAVAAFWRELQACAARFKGIGCEGQFDRTDKREVTFLDTPDETISLNGYVFRQRRDLENDRTEFTLKRRSPDRIIAAAGDVKASPQYEAEQKIEEDVGAPFVVRFSASCTVRGSKQPPESLGAAGRMFPALLNLKRDDADCSDDLGLSPVRGMKAFERVMKGPILQFGKIEAEVAIIFWSDGAEGRPLVAEHSFRYSLSDESNVSPKVARLAMSFFLELQRMDWCLPGAVTKTGYMYGDA